MKLNLILGIAPLLLPPLTGTAQVISIGIPQPNQGSGTIGRSFGFNGAPRGQQWLEVIETMLRSQDRAWVNSADANICLYGDTEVVQALHRLYFAEGLSDYRNQIVRPLAGLQQESAAREAQKILLMPEYPPDHPLVTQSAHSVLRKLDTNGVQSIIEKLHQWGSLPSTPEINAWAGRDLSAVLSEKVSPEQKNTLKKVFLDQSGRNSGARYGAAAALGMICTTDDFTWLQEASDQETNSLVKERLEEIISLLTEQAAESEPMDIPESYTP